jgi:hypothetical protein
MRALLAALALLGVQGPWLLTAIPSVGTVTWRCQAGTYGLGFRAYRDSATDEVTFRAGVRVVHEVVQPGQWVRFPASASLRQQLEVLQSIEPGTLRATVDVDFAPTPTLPSHCFSYLPPAVTVQVYPR